MGWVSMFPLGLLGDEVASNLMQLGLGRYVDGHVPAVCAFIGATQSDKPLENLV